MAVTNSTNNAFKDKEKPMAVRTANIVAARAVADAIRTVHFYRTFPTHRSG